MGQIQRRKGHAAVPPRRGTRLGGHADFIADRRSWHVCSICRFYRHVVHGPMGYDCRMEYVFLLLSIQLYLQ